MRKLFTVIFIFLIGYYVGNHNQKPREKIPAPQIRVGAFDSPQAQKVARLEAIFSYYHSPLTAQAAYLVGVASEYGIDYRILPGIAFTESTLCKNYIKETRNCFGWDNGKKVFSDFEGAENYVLESLRYDRPYQSWRNDQNNINELGRIYNGPTPEKWAQTVKNFMKEVE